MKGSHGFGLTMNGFEHDLLPHLHKKDRPHDFLPQKTNEHRSKYGLAQEADDWLAFQST
jgi:hypothetical protein